MRDVLEYIMANYTWLLGGAIIILLAIIGSYADKTNFGQGKETKDDKKNKKDEDTALKPKEEVNDSLDDQNKEDVDIQSTETIEEPALEEVVEPVEDNQVVDTSETSEDQSRDEQFEKLDQEFNKLMPEKEVINDDLLDEIDNLSLDKTGKIPSSEIPDLDDVELPEIKQLKQEDEDIWKF